MNTVYILRTNRLKKNKRIRKLLVPIALTLLIASCHHKDIDNTVTPAAIVSTSINVVPIVSDVSNFGATKIDTNLVNAWGMTLDPNGNFWINSSDAGKVVNYDKFGNSLRTPISVSFGGDKFGGNPTGIVFNNSSGFIIPSQGVPARYIFVTENGTIDAWASGDVSIPVVDNSALGAVYKGLAMASDGGVNFLYAANFGQKRVDVYDQNFKYVSSKQFNDPNMPTDYGPFNVYNLNGTLYVTYAKVDTDGKSSVRGTGLGFVNVFNPNGAIIKRFVSQGSLNAPWGVAQAPAGFGSFEGAILIGNFGDGRITAYTKDGGSMGQLENNSNPISIDGLWALQFGPSGSDKNLYFTSGPSNETHGLFGYITTQGGGGTGSGGGGVGGTGGHGGTSGGIGTSGGGGAGTGGGASGY